MRKRRMRLCGIYVRESESFCRWSHQGTHITHIRAVNRKKIHHSDWKRTKIIIKLKDNTSQRAQNGFQCDRHNKKARSEERCVFRKRMCSKRVADNMRQARRAQNSISFFSFLWRNPSFCDLLLFLFYLVKKQSLLFAIYCLFLSVNSSVFFVLLTIANYKNYQFLATNWNFISSK